MAVIKMNLPKCNRCGEVWLPQKGPARSDPREYDAELRAKGRTGLRCGKCKSPAWDQDLTGDREKKPRSTESPGAIDSGEAQPSTGDQAHSGSGLEKLYGILKDAYTELGGGEAYLKAERNWGPDAWERYEKEEKGRKENRK